MLYFAAMGSLAFTINKLAGFAIGGLGAVLVIVMDACFSVLATALFLRPINEVLDGSQEPVQIPAGYKRLQKTKQRTFIGCALAVGSSTLAYISYALHVAVRGPFFRNPWLHPSVFSFPLKTILNDASMLMVSDSLEPALDVVGMAFCWCSVASLVAPAPPPPDDAKVAPAPPPPDDSDKKRGGTELEY